MNPLITLLLIGLGVILQSGIEASPTYAVTTAFVWLFILLLNSVLS